MTEDSRISEIRAELDSWHADGPPIPRDVLNRIRAILDRPAPDHDRLPADVQQRVDEAVVRVEAAAKVVHVLATVAAKSNRSDMAGWLAEVAIAINAGREWPTLAPLTAPRVFFPGDTVPSGVVVAIPHVFNGFSFYFGPINIGPSDGYAVELPVPSQDEMRAMADRARADREDKVACGRPDDACGQRGGSAGCGGCRG